MRGLDTNILVRFLTEDDTRQTKQAAAVLAEAEQSRHRLFVSTVALCEFAWTLRSAPYRCDRTVIAQFLELMLDTKVLEFQSRDSVQQALADFRSGRGDFADYLISRENQAFGCKDTITFDRKLTGPLFEIR